MFVHWSTCITRLVTLPSHVDGVTVYRSRSVTLGCHGRSVPTATTTRLPRVESGQSSGAYGTADKHPLYTLECYTVYIHTITYVVTMLMYICPYMGICWAYALWYLQVFINSVFLLYIACPVLVDLCIVVLYLIVTGICYVLYMYDVQHTATCIVHIHVHNIVTVLTVTIV